MQELVVATFYHLVHLENFYDMKGIMLECCNKNSIKGTILLSEEGINGTIAGGRDGISEFFLFLKSDSRLTELSWKEDFSTSIPFMKMKVGLKHEVVSMGVEGINSTSKRGEYLDPEEWDEFLVNERDMILIDTRNDYEIEIGSFKDAIFPDTKCFRDFPFWADRWAAKQNNRNVKVVMYCTGGIRCEKATAYMKSIGFSNVYHLKGGILEYLRKTGNHNNLWRGNCFVFDDRIAVDDNLSPAQDLMCFSCDNKADVDSIRNSSRGVVFCKKCNLLNAKGT